MTIGLAIYNLSQSIEDNVNMVEALGRYLGLKNEPLRFDPSDDRNDTPTEISVQDVTRDQRLRIDRYSLEISDKKDDEYILRNTGASVNFVKGKRSAVLFAHTNSLEFASFLGDSTHRNVLAVAKGQYGFVLDWKSEASFWAFAAGFVDFKSTNGDLSAVTPAGLWGVDRRAKPEATINGKFRDIYEYNLITDKQLERAIHGSTVRNLLQSQRSSFGELSRLAEDWYEWVVPRENIPFVRREFLAAGLLDPRFVDETITA